MIAHYHHLYAVRCSQPSGSGFPCVLEEHFETFILLVNVKCKNVNVNLINSGHALSCSALHSKTIIRRS